jgi:uncharacterized membrane protein
MAKKGEQAPLTVAFAEYDDPDAARNALNQLQQMERDGSIDIVDAGLIEKQRDGKAKITDTAKHARRKDLATGALVGGVVGLLFPPGLIASAAVGGIAGEVVGRMRHHPAFNNQEMKDAAADMTPGTSALVAIVEQKWIQQLETAAEGYSNLITQGVPPDAAASVTAIVEEDSGTQ